MSLSSQRCRRCNTVTLSTTVRRVQGAVRVQVHAVSGMPFANNHNLPAARPDGNFRFPFADAFAQACRHRNREGRLRPFLESHLRTRREQTQSRRLMLRVLAHGMLYGRCRVTTDTSLGKRHASPSSLPSRTWAPLRRATAFPTPSPPIAQVQVAAIP